MRNIAILRTVVNRWVQLLMVKYTNRKITTVETCGAAYKMALFAFEIFKKMFITHVTFTCFFKK